MRSSERYYSLFETSSDGIVVINSRGIIDDVNVAVVKLFGFEKDELVGKNVSLLMDETYSEKHDGYIRNYLKTGVAKIIGIGREVVAKKKNGTLFPMRLAVSDFEIDGNIFFTGIIHDLTETRRKEEIIKQYSEELEKKVEKRTQLLQKQILLKEKAEQALIKSQKLYETIADNFPNGAILVLDKNFTIEFVNGTELFPYNIAKNIGRDECIFSYLPKEIATEFKNYLALVLENKPQTWEFSFETKTFKMQCVPIVGNDDVVHQILIVKTNITEAKKAEQEIYKTLLKEKKLNDLKASFVSMASHEFRTPLTSIQSSASLIEMYKTDADHPKRQKHTEKIKNNIAHVTSLLNDFLSLERVDSGVLKNKPVRFVISSFVEEVLEEIEPNLKINQHIIYKHNTEESEVYIDPLLLKNVVFNLLSNAIKYSDKDVFLDTSIQNERLWLTIKDQGIGISKEDQKNLFNRFFRASNAGQVQGTGLGLNIVKRYVGLMNGEISFQSELNVGSVFQIKIDGRQA